MVLSRAGTRRCNGLPKQHVAHGGRGAAPCALAARSPLAPGGCGGTDRLARLGPLRVRYGEPIQTADLSELGPADAARVATDRLQEAVGTLEESLA